MKLPSPAATGVGFAAMALAHRAVLSGVYYGQEEGDYGNLGLILGTVQSGFRYVETEHMPLYTWLSAAVCALTGDAHTAGLAVSLVMGSALVGLMTWCAARWLSAEAGLVAGLLLVFQPDLALTSATTLRASTYGAFAAATLLAAGQGRWLTTGALFGAAFLTRFDAMFSLLPALALGAVWPALQAQAAPRWRRAAGMGIAGGFIALWAAIYHREHGTARFWEGVVARNTASYEQLSVLERIGKGSETLLQVAGRVLPDHLGWAVLALAPVGLVFVARGRARSQGPARLAGLVSLTSGGLFVLLVLVSAYRWDHNLYWSWLAVAVPFTLPLAAHGAVELLRALPVRRAGVALLALGLAGATALPMYRQTWQQVIRSDAWMGTQVRLANWADRAAPADAVLLADLVPATWLGRRPNARPVIRWTQFGDEPAPGDAEAFAGWIWRERVRVVFWFREDWIGASDRAPFLSRGEVVQAAGLTFTPVAREDGYGVIVYRVDGRGLPALAPESPPLRSSVAPAGAL